jgi:hypothetical protein
VARLPYSSVQLLRKKSGTDAASSTLIMYR